MTKEEALFLIKEKNLEPIRINESLHITSEDYELDGFLIQLFWGISSDIENPLVEIYDIEKQFEIDSNNLVKNLPFLRVLPDCIYDRLLLEKSKKDLEGKELFPNLNKKAKEFCQRIHIDNFITKL